ncbi:MAG: class I SAM-dependent methyltransferase [Gammaproteobacteria bacterium]
MTDNRGAYADGLLDRALNRALQPPEIRAYLDAELELLDRLIEPGMRVLDVGCGTGRHLLEFADRLGPSVGIDYENHYVDIARAAAPSNIRFLVADAVEIPLEEAFDLAICMMNTWGTMEAQDEVVVEMRRLAPQPDSRVISVYTTKSVPARLEWYERLGHHLLEQGEQYLQLSGGFRSQHFTESELTTRLGACSKTTLGGIGVAARF